jgi:glycine C-acetyltransferase
VDFIMSSFSKPTASIGGFFVANKKYCTLLQPTATSYIFQACLSPPDAATILAALDEIAANPGLAATLHARTDAMRALLVAEGFDLGTSQSPVIPVYVPDLEKLCALCARLYLNEGRIRFIVNARHTEEQIARTVRVLADEARALGILVPGQAGEIVA